MATEIIMPKVGLTMIEGMITRWLRKEGDPVKAGEPVMVIMTEKVEIEILAEGSGVLHRVVEEGVNVPATAVVGWLLAPGEKVPDGSAPRPPTAQAVAVSNPVAQAEPAATAPSAGSSPAARRLASELGVDLSRVKATGPGGKILEGDVRKAAEEKKPAAAPASLTPAPAPAKAPAPTGKAGVREVIPMRGVRKMVAEHMFKSLQSTAQMSGMMEVDATELVKLRTALLKEWEPDGVRVTYTDLVVKAVAKALKKYPRLNSNLVGNEIHIMEPVNVGVAVALPDGLVVPVVRDADKKDLKEIARNTKELGQKAKASKLSLDDVSGGTFTVSSMGMYNTDMITPIVNTPEVGILGIGVIREKPAIHNGQVVTRNIMHLCMTVDHQVVDGAPAMEFCNHVAGILESPYLLFI